MIQGEKKLSDIEHQSTRGEVFNSSWSNDVSKYNSYIYGRSLFKTSELTKVNEVVGDYMELKMFFNYLFKKLSNCVEKNNGTIQLRKIEHSLVRFGNNNCGWSLEIRQPMFQISTDISDIDEFANTLFTSNNRLDISPG